MWNRAELKAGAKLQLKGRYWNYLGISLIPSLVSYVISIPLSIIYQVLMFGGMVKILSSSELISEFSGDLAGAFSFFDYEGIFDIIESSTDPWLLIKGFLPAVFFMIIAEFLVAVLVMAPVLVGVTRWYVRSRESASVKASVCFSAFRGDTYLKTVGSMLYYNFWLFVWFMLFYIPGIVKSYAYRMVPYILADNPGIGARRALKLSCAMTKGHKFDIFVLELSFLGWQLLGLLACCIGVIAVVPYYNATMAELYDSLKRSAVEKGLCTMEELGYMRTTPLDTISDQNS